MVCAAMLGGDCGHQRDPCTCARDTITKACWSTWSWIVPMHGARCAGALLCSKTILSLSAVGGLRCILPHGLLIEA